MPSGDADPVRPPCSLTLQRRPPTILGTHREAAASSYKLSRVSKVTRSRDMEEEELSLSGASGF